MIPAEFIIASALAVGITVPVATVIEAAHPQVDMSRYEIRQECPVGDAVIASCLFDTETGEVIGGKP